ncbi:hypothetical protein [Myroides pelagicus]|uniref:Uncharacterized protein n=1 Tax=Myroides pelagicus TaxID=270914 RepID=A0A7K1GMG9_9FLAO|nr:hypothetical protein [Myroides pelagicus]MTH29729.1 hypothetical protein [Myroides pelagicus]
MKKTYIGFAGLSLLLLLGTQSVQAQQGFGTDKPHRSAAVDIQSSKRGLLIPRVDLVETTNGKTPINDPLKSLMVYNQATTTKGTATDVTPGYYYWDGAKWVRFAQQSSITEITLAGDVTGKTGETKVVALQGTSISNVDPTANQVLTFVNGEWVPTSITPDVITKAKGITGTGITVEGTDNGAGAVLKDVTLSITHGGANQVMVTNADGNGTTWVDQSVISPTTTNTLTSTGNTMTSNVNDVSGTAEIVNTIGNTIVDNKLVTTVNGKAGEGLDLTPAIQAGQKITTVADGVNTTVTSSVYPVGSNTTEYKVNVSNQAIQAAQKLTTVSQGAGVKVTPDTTTTANTTDYKVAIDTEGATKGQVLTVGEDGSSTTWTTPAEMKNIYTHDGMLTANRTVDFGDFNVLKFEKEGQSHRFTYDEYHTGINMYGNTTSSINLITNESRFNDAESKLQLFHKKDKSEINSNAIKGLWISAGKDQVITLGNRYTIEGENNLEYDEHVVIKANGAVQAKKINNFKGNAQEDKLVVADNTGVLKTVERKKVAPQFFYMPAVIFDTKTAKKDLTRDLYQDYVNQFTGGQTGVYNIAHGASGSTMPYTGGVIGSKGAPEKMDVYERGELYYYVTYYDTKVFANISIDENGVLKYDIIGTATPASYMNIVFVIK